MKSRFLSREWIAGVNGIRRWSPVVRQVQSTSPPGAGWHEGCITKVKVTDMSKIVIITLMTILLLGAAGVGIAAAANSAAPGDALYKLDRQIETLQLQLSKPEQQARLQKQFADERLDELESLAAHPGAAPLDQAVEAVEQELANSEAAAGAQEQDPDDEGGKQPKQSPYCTSETVKQHPSGVSLAQEYGVDYNEIMGWYCMGFGFGEVKLAYSMGAQYGVEPALLFSRRIGGEGWGAIKQDLKAQSEVGAEHGKGKDKENPGKGHDKDKDKDKDKEKDKTRD